MYLQNITTNQTNVASAVGSSPSVSASTLESMAGYALIGDLDAQLSDIMASMEEGLAAKTTLREDISAIEALASRETSVNAAGADAVAISTSEKEFLVEGGLGESSFEIQSDGSYLVATEVLTGLTQEKQDELAGINSNSELTMLTVQSLVDQRKNAMTMLSNLMASSNEVLMNIIRNLKS